MTMRLLVLALVWVSPLSVSAQDSLLITGKSITIQGQTSLGKFACTYSEIHQPEAAFIRNGANSIPVLFLELLIEDFDCGNKILNKDFRETLRAAEHPSIGISVDNFRKIENYYLSTVSLTLGGKVSELLELRFIKIDKHGNTYLKSEFKLSTSSFELSPPKKLFGLIKLRETLEVSICLYY
ncbi:hypothetical protein [Roseivirga thermotolerans]|uniref:Lipid/polyisoprenoid-binding YceI-like domain-containing protein n=1 Tax=Roseivirga thermotolerans TaxID=1758176 RepID=A0ABQ3IAJ1_9BACT|nr:hypothetical protein [Roseivirga thermotolerans]GHE70409.1 hypothetical protein GCM10011340_27590 [Roseivirga thermotolerans]